MSRGRGRDITREQLRDEQRESEMRCRLVHPWPKYEARFASLDGTAYIAERLSLSSRGVTIRLKWPRVRGKAARRAEKKMRLRAVLRQVA